jgi:hypothetical protein
VCEGCWGVYLKFGCREEDKERDIHKACMVKWFVNTGMRGKPFFFFALSPFSWGIWHASVRAA